MRNISFISGTRADYGKIKPYIDFLVQQKDTKVFVFITGMNMLKKYGSTYKHIQKDLKKNCTIILDKKFQELGAALEMAHIIQAFDNHLKKEEISFVFVHGDRPEVLAASSTAVLNNIPVCHIEAGDLSGSVDELIRHATSKLASRFLVADKQAEQILLQLGEERTSIHITGNSSLSFLINPPTPKETAQLNQIKNYGILLYHPVTTLKKSVLKKEAVTLMQQLEITQKEYIVIAPNNDLGSDIILKTYQQYQHNKKFHFFKSLSFEAFNYALKNADFLVGNSSCGIKEAPFYGVPVINIGCRQNNRFQHLMLKNFYHLDSPDNLSDVISKIKKSTTEKRTINYREDLFKKLESIFTEEFFNAKIQKPFQKISLK